MERDNGSFGKVVSMMNQAGTARRVAAEVRAYWEGLRRGRMVPPRSEVDPRGIERALEYAFIIERVAPGMGRFRLAGMHLNDLMGMEVRGMPLTAMFTPEARKRVADATEVMFNTPAVVELTLTGETGIGKPPLTAKLLMLPLKSDLGDVTRALGCLVAEGEAIGRTPRRFEVVSVEVTEIVAGEPLAGPAPVAADRLREMGFAEPQSPFVPRVAKPGAAAPQAPRPSLAATTPEQRRAMFRVVASED